MTDERTRSGEGPEPNDGASDLTARMTEDQRRLAADNMKLAHYITSRNSFRWSPSMTLEEATSEALLALCRAAMTWSPDGGAKFSTYAANGILFRFRSLQAGRERSKSRKEGVFSPVMIPMSVIDAKAGQTPSRATSDGRQRDGNSFSLAELAVSREPDPQDAAADTEKSDLVHDLVTAALKILPPKRADLLRRRYGLTPYDPRGITRKALAKRMRKPLYVLKSAEDHALRTARLYLTGESSPQEVDL